MSRSCLGRRSCSVLKCFWKQHPSPAVTLPTAVEEIAFPLLWLVGVCCGFLLCFVQFWEGLWSIALLYSQSFLFLAVDLGHCQTVVWQWCFLHELSHGNKNCRLTLLFGHLPFTVRVFPLLYMSSLYVSSLLASWFVVVTLPKKTKHPASFRTQHLLREYWRQGTLQIQAQVPFMLLQLAVVLKTHTVKLCMGMASLRLCLSISKMEYLLQILL